MNSVSKSLIERLTQYLITAQKWELTKKDIDKFLNFLNKNESLLKKLDTFLDELFELVKTYTEQFAEVNNYVYYKETKRKTNHNDKVINLKEYLKVQKNIYSYRSNLLILKYIIWDAKKVSILISENNF